MTLAAKTRAAVRDHPFLHDALRAGIINYTATARYLDVGETEAVAAALRRYADELESRDFRGDAPNASSSRGDVRVTMQSGLGIAKQGPPVLVVGDTRLVHNAGSLTAVLASGECSPPALRDVLGRCETHDLDVRAAGVASGTLLVVVPRRDGPDAVRQVEAVFE